MKLKDGSLQDVAKKLKEKKKQNLEILFKTVNMEAPRLLYQKSKAVDGYVSIMAQFMPTFQEVQPQDQENPINFVQDPDDIEEVEMDMNFEKKLSDKEPKFFFILDRSWSMDDHNRINIALEALKLFLLSLPAKCGFQIISFGSFHCWLDEKRDLLPYNDENLKRIKDEIVGYKDAFLGGTELYNPLKELFELKKHEKFKDQHWNVFLLTDGCVSDHKKITDLIKFNCLPQNGVESKTKVYAMGIGNDVDEVLVNESARAGNGKSYFAKDSGTNELNKLVIEALQDVTVPFL